MPAYKTYEWERTKWPEYREITVNLKQQRMYIRKLSKHFKVKEPTVITKRGGWGYAYCHSNRIKIPKECSLGMTIHEFAHILAWQRHQHRGHGKPFKRELNRCYTWAKRWLPTPVSA